MTGLLITRLLWLFESELMTNLMLGYDLDRALMLRKTDPSLLDSLWKLSSNKIFILSEKHDSPTHSMTPSQHRNHGGVGGPSLELAGDDQRISEVQQTQTSE
jgi:hypothetical protein